MQCNTPAEIARLCYDVARFYSRDPGEAPGWEKVALLLGTTAVETSLMRSAQTSGLGLWNIPLSKAMEVFRSDLRYSWLSTKKQRAPWRIFVRGWLGIRSPKWFMPNEREMRWLLVHDDAFACSMAMWFYLGKPEIPENLTHLAEYWYRHYPSGHGTRKPLEFMDFWADSHCDTIMTGLGYG